MFLQKYKITRKFPLNYIMLNNCKIFSRYIYTKNEINGIFNNVFKNILNDKTNTLQSIYNKYLYLNLNKVTKRFYNPRENINWILIRFRHRVSQLRKKKLKYKNHSKVALRFRLTKFGWERLQSGRNASKKNLSVKKYNEKMKIKYVSRDDIKKFKFQMPSYVLRIRDSPVDYNPNIMKARKFLPSHFG
ncbi:conserved Plasmodium protein, unknown function [Plasmodium gallinaceum]|uniref:Uncharacterized protein n=1 Tax=Plasmodium gallinaceum TaxID=5849 RepID=A0A1J1GY89_PLAGA|nr:conserved Plasmodium protein, unknown function [Plasmodium gallinaceum]CRG97271.1 conserved Plasmodium protein, unknown function [Plasmodium gallinaceum]